MLLKTKDGLANRMIHKGIWYQFLENEVKDCPSTMLSAFRGVLIMAEQRVKDITQPPIKEEKSSMPIISVDSITKEPTPKKVVKKKSTKKKAKKNKNN